MTEVRKVNEADFESIYSQLLCDFDPRRSREVWRRIFRPGWINPEKYSGYGLFDGPSMVGFVGLIFAEMPGGTANERLCNVTTWISREEYRGEAALLLFPLRSLRDYTITNLSCNEVAASVFSSLGFKRLETAIRIIRPSLSWPEASADECSITHNPMEIESVVDASDRQILRDHIPFTDHLVLSSDEGYCYVVYTRGRRLHLPTTRIHYISNQRLFVRYVRRILWSLLCRERTFLAECDERWLDGAQVSQSVKRDLPVPRFFLSARLAPSQITSLYSERVLLNLG